MTITKTFRALPGYFITFPNENAKPVDSSKINHLELNECKSWKQLYDSIPKDTPTHEYKILIVARHGQGYHNAAIDRYGEDKWDEYWSMLEGDEHGEWVDSKLTPLGKKQVFNTGSNVILPIIQDLGFLPHIYFSSPMRRCLETFIESWTPVFCRFLPPETEVSPFILENLRETLGEHTCDKRVDHSIAVEEYQNYKMKSNNVITWKYSENYPEVDQLWSADWREPQSEMDARVNNGLIEVFEKLSPEEKLVSITCHSGVIGSILRNLKHPEIQNLDTGKIVAVVVEVAKH